MQDEYEQINFWVQESNNLELALIKQITDKRNKDLEDIMWTRLSVSNFTNGFQIQG